MKILQSTYLVDYAGENQKRFFVCCCQRRLNCSQFFGKQTGVNLVRVI